MWEQITYGACRSSKWIGKWLCRWYCGWCDWLRWGCGRGRDRGCWRACNLPRNISCIKYINILNTLMRQHGSVSIAILAVWPQAPDSPLEYICNAPPMRLSTSIGPAPGSPAVTELKLATLLKTLAEFWPPQPSGGPKLTDPTYTFFEIISKLFK